MRKIVLGLFFLLLAGIFPALAQEKTISGKVSSKGDGSPLPAVTVAIKGTNRAAQTDASGNYSIRAAVGQTLQFTSVGFLSKEVKVGNASRIDISLESDNKQLGEVVVTAFGQAKEKKALGYSVQQVGGEEIAQTGRTNFINSLQGRVAGLDIGTTGGMPGASSTIVLRGGTSFDGNNQPLFVIDGIPVDNSTLAEGSLLNDGANRGADYNNRIADIDPNDIENITVLKGPAATALYGIDAANGAIVITTKKGKLGSMSVTYNNNFRFEKNTRFPERQTVYGTGTNGVSADNVISHWGDKIPSGTPIYDNVKNFFKTGFLNSHNLSVAGGTRMLSGNVSFNQLDQDGTVPHTGYKRQSLKMGLSSELSPKLHINGSANYIYTNNKKGTKGANSFYYYSLIWPITADMSNWVDNNGERVNLLDGTEDYFDNPYFDLNRNGNSEENKRILLNGSVSYDVANWFNITGRAGYDTYTTYGLTFYDPESNQTIPNKANAKAVGGVMLDYTQRFSLLNYYLLMNFKHKIGNFNGTLTTGLNIDQRENRVDSRYGETFIVPGLVSINNTDRDTREAETRGYRRRLVGVFGDFKIDYKNYLFLNLTGRNDWSSTLPLANRSFFYPSASMSFVFTDAFRSLTSDFLSYGKLRASVAQVGKDAPPHKWDPALTAFTRTGGGFAVGFFGGNPNIRPETTTSTEFGGEFRFLNNRLSLDVTYYSVKSKDQIVSPRLSYASGYILQIVNAGTMQNRGLEVMASAKPIQRKEFSWNVSANFYFNRNKVVELPGGFSEFYLSDTWLAGNVRAGYVPGQSYYSFTGYGYKYNEKGEMLIGDNGYPVRDATFHLIGNRQPKFNMGLTNRFQYKNWFLSFLWDWRNGGDIFNATDYSLTYAGLSKRTLDRGKMMVFPGVNSTTGLPNTQEVQLSQAYYTSATLGGYNEYNFIERDIYWFRLRDVNLSYSLPARLFTSSFIKSVDVSAGASNLVLISNYTGADPDVNGLNASNRGSGAVGFDYFSLPAPIAFQFGITARF